MQYQTRRRALAARLPKESVALIPAAKEVVRNGDSTYRFRQDSDFYYLTGFNEPDALLVVNAEGESYVFNRPRAPEQEQWTGARLGQELAPERLKVDAAFSIEDLDRQLPDFLTGKQAIYFALGRCPQWDARIVAAWSLVKGRARRGVRAPDAFCDLQPILGEMRLFKSPDEIALMQRAVDISVAAHHRAMRVALKAQYEYELEAELVYDMTRLGARSLAYDSIVAGGANACVLHYTANNAPLCRGDLVLIDAGGEFENYASDLTRTFPLNGQFSAEQREIYALVLQAQKAGMACVRPGHYWNEVQQAVVRTLTSGLCDLGLLKGSVDGLITQEAYKSFYMHNSGHWLGLDVHDVGSYQIQGAWRPFEPGMVLTVEPGLYISPNHPGIDPRWGGIGIRIEDDVLVTGEGCQNLSQALVSEIDDIEALVRGG